VKNICLPPKKHTGMPYFGTREHEEAPSIGGRLRPAIGGRLRPADL